jgi:hypothetical protein
MPAYEKSLKAFNLAPAARLYAWRNECPARDKRAGTLAI